MDLIPWILSGLVALLIAVALLFEVRGRRSRSQAFSQFLEEMVKTSGVKILSPRKAGTIHSMLRQLNLSAFRAYKVNAIRNSAHIDNKHFGAKYFVADTDCVRGSGRYKHIVQQTLFLFETARDIPAHVLCGQSPDSMKRKKVLNGKGLQLHRLYPNGRSLEAWLPDELGLADVENSEFGQLFTSPKSRCYYAEVQAPVCLLIMSVNSVVGKSQFESKDMKASHLHKLHAHAVELFSAFRSVGSYEI